VRAPVIFETWMADGLRAERVRPPEASVSLGIDSIRAHTEAKFRELNALRNGQFHGRIYPSGVMLKQAMGLPKEAPKVAERGDIEGFSDKASRRLKEAFLTLFVPEFELWAVTLTTHRMFKPAIWRAIMKRFRMGVKRRGWAGIWRVELQRRQTPHAHVAMWVPKLATLAMIEELWLECTGEAGDAAAVEHAVVGRRIPQDASGWVVYMALHDGKHKEEQLGWLGKQWGVWNRDVLQAREPYEFELPEKLHAKLLRVLAHWDRSKREGIQRAKFEQEKLMMPDGLVTLGQRVELVRGRPRIVCEIRRVLPASLTVGGVLVAQSTEPTNASLVHVAPPRPKLTRMHRGNLLRCMPGDDARRIVDALLSGRIY